MNWINHTTKFTTVLRFAFLFCALFVFVNTGRAETKKTEEPEELIVKKEQTKVLNDINEITLKSITVAEGGLLRIESGTMVHLSDGKLFVDGTLEVSSVLGTGIYSGTRWWDIEEGAKEITPTRTILHINGGEIKILEGSTKLYADTIDVQLGTGGGTIDVAGGVIFKSGAINGPTTGGMAGDVLKTGDGTFQVGAVTMGGNFTIEAGTVEFLDLTRINSNFILKQGTAHFHDTTRIGGNFTLENGHAEFLGAATIVRNFTIEEGTVEFHNIATISGNLTVGKAGKEADEKNPAEVPKRGIVEFFDTSTTATITGILDVQEGSVHFHGNASVGVLRIADGMVVSGVPLIEKIKKCKEGCEECEEECETEETTKKHNLTITGANNKIEGILKDIGTLAIARGGEITGTGILTEIDYLIVGGETLTIDGNNHTIERIGIARNATLNIKGGTSIQLGSKETENTYDDLTIEGTLRISSAAIGIYKGYLDPDNLEHHLEPAHITVAGGTVEIYQGEDETKTVLRADTLHTQVVGIGMIKVASGVTFESGDIKWSNRGDRRLTGAGIILSGGGTYRAGKVDLGTGYRC